MPDTMMALDKPILGVEVDEDKVAMYHAAYRKAGRVPDPCGEGGGEREKQAKAQVGASCARPLRGGAMIGGFAGRQGATSGPPSIGRRGLDRIAAMSTSRPQYYSGPE